MMKNILTEEQMKVKENLDEKLQQEIEPQSQLEELDDYLIMLAEMSNIGIHRKILLLEGYINKVKNKLKNIPIKCSLAASFIEIGKVRSTNNFHRAANTKF